MVINLTTDAEIRHNDTILSMGRISLVLSYFVFTPAIVLLALVFSLFIDYQTSDPHQAAPFKIREKTTAFAALPATEGSDLIQTAIVSSDAREVLVQQFFQEYHSPLEPFASDVVKAADQYNLDFRLVPAIAMQESGLCKVIPDNSYNCWGFGIYTGHVTRFSSYQEGIDTVTRTLATKYKSLGLTSPQEIMKLYTPSSPNGAWANGVDTFMSQLE